MLCHQIILIILMILYITLFLDLGCFRTRCVCGLNEGEGGRVFHFISFHFFLEFLSLAPCSFIPFLEWECECMTAVLG